MYLDVEEVLWDGNLIPLGAKYTGEQVCVILYTNGHPLHDSLNSILVIEGVGIA